MCSGASENLSNKYCSGSTTLLVFKVAPCVGWPQAAAPGAMDFFVTPALSS